MSLDTAFRLIRTRMETIWPTVEPTVELAWPREDFQRPDSAPWLLVEVRWSGGAGVSIGAPGNNLARRNGMIWLHAFVQVGTGDERAFQIAARAASIFEDQDLGGGVICEAMMPGGAESGSDDGLWTAQSVSLPFWYDESV